ncbi:MAG: sensor histidine kinase [Bacillota bacterium]
MKGIRNKFWLSITSLVLAILLLIWLLQVGLLNKFYINERRSTLLNEANRIASLILETKDDTFLSEAVVDEIHSFTSSVNARILILDRTSDVLFMNGFDKIDPRKGEEDRFQKRYTAFLSKDEEIKVLIGKKQSFFVLKNFVRLNEPPEEKGMSIHDGAPKNLNVQPVNEALMIVGVPILDGKNNVGNVIITSPLAPIEETISILKKQLTFISIFSLAIGTFLALFLARFFTKPIVNITEVSREIAKGNFDASVAIKSDDEIGVLGETINNMAKQLNKIEQLRKDLIANITHELKTPISLVKAYAELVKEMDNMDVNEKKQYLQVIVEESDRLNNMIEDILYLSKMESGYSNLTADIFSLEELVHCVIEKLAYFIRQKNIEVNLELESKSNEIYGDKDKLYQVFYNIINNAIQYSHDGGKIMIKAFESNDALRIEIIDNGSGIPAEDLPYIWDRFYKVDKSGTRNQSGTGLGMSIVKNILEAHDFRYGIESEPGKGTKVWIEIA